MILWFISFVLITIGFIQLHPFLMIVRANLTEAWGLGKRIRSFQLASNQLFQLQEILSSGLVPEPDDWNRLSTLPDPWCDIAVRSVADLRDQGAPVLPTLKRLRVSLNEQVELMQESQAKSSQAWSQALLGVVIVPLFALVLYTLLPEVKESSSTFFMVTLVSFLLTMISVIWISIMVDQARFGGVKREHQGWYGSALAGVERLWAFIGTGLPADLAWKAMIEELAKTDSLLAQNWGPSVWSSEVIPQSLLNQNEFDRLMINLGQEIKKSIQSSLVEGRGCLERMEGIHRSFLTEYRLKLIQKLNVLPQRCLKPLFICLLPAIFLLLFTGLGLCAKGL